MIFKLVRTDSEDPCKIQLPLGTHTFGRGVFLDCDDKRVSRSHGELAVSDDTVVLKALHQNPCFYIRKNASESQILRQDSTVSLTNGDKFGLLPSSYWYEVLHCSLSTTQPTDNLVSNGENSENKENEVAVNGSRNEDSAEMNDEDDSALLALNFDETVSNVDQNDSQSVLPQESTEMMTLGSNTQSYSLPPDAVGKRSHSITDEESTKKIKIEPNDSSISVNIDAQPSSSTHVKPEPASPAAAAPPLAPVAPPPSPVAPPPAPAEPARERCIYGEKCYRQNPAHKASYSHPMDADWASGACPYGAQCRRRDPRHWAAHSHPPGAAPPSQPPQPAPRPKKKKEEVGEVSPRADAVLPAKRPRKTVKRPSWSDSESENDYDMEDPFLTDGSDDWEPPSDISESQDFESQVVDSQDL